jgi:hypothetical protein
MLAPMFSLLLSNAYIDMIIPFLICFVSRRMIVKLALFIYIINWGIHV